MKFRKKPVVIDAVQWDVTMDAEFEIKALRCPFKVATNPDYLLIETLEGVMRVDPWDWIVKGVEGEFYPVKPHIFEKTYEPVESVEGV